IWHNQRIKKSDPYVALLLEQILELLGGDLREFKLVGLQWSHAPLAERDLSRADLRDAHLPYANLQAADLSGALLRRCNLTSANLRDADLKGADLRLSNLHGADLRGASLTDALIDDCVLIGADLRGADFHGASLNGFIWNRRTRFDGVRGFDPQDDPDDATQLFATPMAMPGLDSRSSSGSDFYDPDLDRTHVYRRDRSSADSLSSVPPPDATMEGVPAQQPPPPPARVIRRPSRSWYSMLAASLLAAVLSCGFGVWAYTRMLDLQLSLVAERQRPDRVQLSNETGSDQAWRERLQQKDLQIEQLMEEVTQHRQLLEQREMMLEEVQATRQEQQLAIARLRTRDDEAQALRLRHQDLKKEHTALLQTNQRLHDTARILRQGLEDLQRDRDELASFKQKHLTDYYNYSRLQTEVDSLRKQHQQVSSKNDSLQLINDSLEQRLLESEQSLKTFLAHIEGSRLKEFLHSDTAEEPLIPIRMDQPMVFGGEYLVTLRVSPGEREGQVRTSLVVQRPANKGLPDINLLLYDQHGKALRSVSYSFPAGLGNTPFASTETVLSSPTFPTSLRLLVNPGLDPRLMARRQAEAP
ncbi:MAG: pentapeptide repeat-containing protein, partial [Planctomycetota bacterium]